MNISESIFIVGLTACSMAVVFVCGWMGAYWTGWHDGIAEDGRLRKERLIRAIREVRDAPEESLWDDEWPDPSPNEQPIFEDEDEPVILSVERSGDFGIEAHGRK